MNVSDLQTNIHAALRAWHKPGGDLQELLDSLMLVQEQRTAVAADGSPAKLRLAANLVLLDAIEELEKQDQYGAQILRWRFPDNNTIEQVAHRLNVSTHTVNRTQRAAITSLSEIIFAHEQHHREQHAQAIEAFLPPASYRKLFGLELAADKLLDQILSDQAPWLIALVGIGGIGKTALADAVTRRAITTLAYDEIIWLRIDHQTLTGQSLSPETTLETLLQGIEKRLWPQRVKGKPSQERLLDIRQALKQHRCLIIIDNLESEADTAFLLSHLNDLAQPSKFLITTRTRPAHQAIVYNHHAEELSLANALALIRHHAQDIGISTVSEASDEELGSIYQLTGGNPLALKLVVSLLDVLPLGQIRTNLLQNKSGPLEGMYRQIYRQTWQTLSPEARTLLQAMPLVAEAGALPDYLQAISTLSDSQFWPAIQELRNRSLLEVRGTLLEKRYGIHRLTATFLQSDITHWYPDQSA